MRILVAGVRGRSFWGSQDRHKALSLRVGVLPPYLNGIRVSP
jgi:hypothetical protein